MPWEKQYSEADVLERAMHAFWANSYEATSVADLVEATGISRGSIYAAYADKRGLFLEALKHYEEAWDFYDEAEAYKRLMILMNMGFCHLASDRFDEGFSIVGSSPEVHVRATNGSSMGRAIWSPRQTIPTGSNTTSRRRW